MKGDSQGSLASRDVVVNQVSRKIVTNNCADSIELFRFIQVHVYSIREAVFDFDENKFMK